MVRREVVGAHYGLRDWLAQRVTAVIMAAYTLAFVAALVRMPAFDFDHWKALWASATMRYATVLFFLGMLFHAWVGVRNIFMDYVKPSGLRLVLHALVIVALVWYAAWAAQILWGM